MTSSSTIATSSKKNSSKTKIFIPYIIHTLIPLNLDTDNFLVWRQQVTATLRSMNLLQFLEGLCIPSHLITL